MKNNHLKDPSLDKQHADLLEDLRLMDDILMNAVFGHHPHAAAHLLNRIFNRTNIEVRDLVIQNTIPSTGIGLRGIRLDIYITDQDHHVYVIEIQRKFDGTIPKRWRFYLGMIDARSLKAGDSFQKLTDVTIISIIEHDPFGYGEPLYHIQPYIEETGRKYDNGSELIYVNGDYQDENTPLGRLIHDLNCSDPNEMYDPILSASVRHFKAQMGGKNQMGKSFYEWEEEIWEKATKEATEKTTRKVTKEVTKEVTKKMKQESLKEKFDIAKKLLTLNVLSASQIAELFSLPLNEIEAIKVIS